LVYHPITSDYYGAYAVFRPFITVLSGSLLGGGKHIGGFLTTFIFPVKPTRINQIQRIIRYVRVPIEALGIEEIENKRIRRQEPTRSRVVHSSLHVNEAKVCVVFLTGEAGLDGVVGQIDAGLAEGIIGAKFWVTAGFIGNEGCRA